MTQPEKPAVVVADDDPNMLKLMEFHLQRWGYTVRCAQNRTELLAILAKETPALLLLDLRFGDDDGVDLLKDISPTFPDLMIVMLTAHGSIDSAVSAIKAGAFEYLTKPPELDRVQLVVERAVEKFRLIRKIQQLEELIGKQAITRPIWGNSAEMRRVQDLITSVAPTNATVLINGESGTGKELVARSIHERSGRREQPFVAVNMAAMPRELIESTLFGHEKGAFTGADQRQRGCCELADRGTLFLDEISELDIDLQAKLLRFLQERTIQRVGSSRTISVDARIVAASNRDPESQVRAGRLREDLFYRLNVVPVHLPPLRERRQDIPVLATIFLRRAAARHGREFLGFSDDALAVLTAMDWPGNVRQLENLVERMAILCKRNEVGAENIPPELRNAPRATKPADAAGRAARTPQPMRQLEKQAIEDALSRANGNVGEAARIIGLSQATVYRKLRRHGLSPKDFVN